MATPCPDPKFQLLGEDRWMTEDEFKQRLSEGLLDKLMIDNDLSFRGIKPNKALADSYGKPEAKTTTEKAQEMAGVIRSMKIKPGELTGGVAAMSFGAKGFEVAWNTAMETVAKAIELGAEGIEAIQKAYDSGWQDIKNSEWYGSLDKEQRKQAYKDYYRIVSEKFPKKPISRAERAAAKEFKGRVEEATGLTPEEKSVRLTPTQAIRRRYRDLAEGGKLTKKALQDIKKEVRDYIDENLPAEKYSKREINRITNAIANATETNLEKVLDRVDKLVERKEGQKESREAKAAEAKRIETAKKIAKMANDRKTLYTKVGNKWVGKISIDAQKEFKDFINGDENGSPLDNLEAKTQQELDAILEVMESIRDTGKADFKRFKEIQDEQKRKVNAELLEGLVSGTNIGRKESDKINPKILNGQEEVQKFLDENDGSFIIVDGQLYSSSNFDKLKKKTSKIDELNANLDDARGRLNELVDQVSEKTKELLKKGISLQSDTEYNELIKNIDSVNKEIESINKNIKDIESKVDPLKEKIKSLKAQNTELSKQALKIREDLISKGLDPKANKEYNSLMDTIESNNESIANAKDEIVKETGEGKAIDSDLENVKGYTKRNNALVKEANLPSNLPWHKKIRKALNPINAMSSIYSLLEEASAGNSKVRKWIKGNISDPLKEAYVNKLEETAKKINDYNDGIAKIFGSKKKAIKRLSDEPKDLNVIQDRASQQVVTTNSHIVSYYNLSRIEEIPGEAGEVKRESGAKRLKKSGVDVDKVREYIESNPDLKEYADFLMDKYKDFKSDYESLYGEYTNTPLPEGTYYPEYAANYDGDFINLDTVMDDDTGVNGISAVSNNMKQRTTYKGDYNIRMDAHTTMLDYIKNMEHAKQFMPIAKKVNQLFNKQNTPYLADALGSDKFNQLREELAVILSDKQPRTSRSEMANFIANLSSVSAVMTLAFKIASIPKQFVGFMHFWTAGIKYGISPVNIISAKPTNSDELDFFYDLMTSNFIKNRIKGGSIDVELNRILDKVKKKKWEKAYELYTKLGMSPTIGGDFAAIVFGPGGGTSFAMAAYRKGLSEGMTKEEARKYAYKLFVTEVEETQQTSRPDLTSSIQREPIFRMMGMFRTGQMAMAKKVINGARVLQNAAKIQKNESVEARREAISDAECVQAFNDVIYYSAFASLMFSAVSSGAAKLIWDWYGYDDDERSRIKYDLMMDQISSTLQGYGILGFFADWAINTLRGDDWKNNIPALKAWKNIQEALPVAADVLPGRTWDAINEKQKMEFIKPGERVVSSEQADLLTKEFNNRILWNKMTEKEKEAMVKAIGMQNIWKAIDNFGKSVEGDKSVLDAIMNWEDDYFKVSTEKRKRDRIFEFLHGEPYIPSKKPTPQGPTAPEVIPEYGGSSGDLFEELPIGD